MSPLLLQETTPGLSLDEVAAGAANARSALVCHHQTANQGLQPVLCQNAPEHMRDCFSAFAARSDEQDARVSARCQSTHVRETKV
jgi:hypothetical protein